jgi:hypothetical protein
MRDMRDTHMANANRSYANARRTATQGYTTTTYLLVAYQCRVYRRGELHVILQNRTSASPSLSEFDFEQNITGGIGSTGSTPNVWKPGTTSSAPIIHTGRK